MVENVYHFLVLRFNQKQVFGLQVDVFGTKRKKVGSIQKLFIYEQSIFLAVIMTMNLRIIKINLNFQNALSNYYLHVCMEEKGFLLFKIGNIKNLPNLRISMRDICQLTGLRCKYRKELQCTSMIGGCKDTGWTSCLWAKETINGPRFYHCKQSTALGCIDQDPLDNYGDLLN
ncbi:unnamed protein product (macronuclear) [Paramecium tetraurelia]|uniref:Uncharacterized protein n=1 Tax=Paramecium tetraurelia TaxID=5888 RepID=A0C1W1_PARTE|nr:uncharacterized protein GSPATT00034255001 [Paramecium tetraurelia]CAK64778.1 unnamed protein product [Paramecium tetraurelia]|eukprot:XP_001432175.1 hypothetical protein (macronuclear) [Paramecium tetraurelia strain d4-2]